MKVSLLAHTENPEKLTAFAARVCYSGAKDLKTLYDSLTNESVDAFLEKMQSMPNHGCYDAETEVLTSHGFVKWPEVKPTDKLAAISIDGKFVGFEIPKKLVKYTINDYMIKVKRRGVDLFVTENHRLYCSLSNTQKKRIHPKFTVLRADEVVSYSNGDSKLGFQLPMRMLKVAKNSKSSNTNPLVFKLYGLFIGDGCAHKDSANVITFHFHKKRKKEYLISLCKELGIELRQLKNDVFGVYEENISKTFRDMFYTHNGEKTFPDSFYNMSVDQFSCFIDGLTNSDGHITADAIEYCTTSKILANKIQTLFCINDIVVSIKVVYPKVTNHLPKYRLRFCMSGKSSMPHINDSRHKDSFFEKIPFVGDVYCARVSTGLLMIRRGGETLICGNTIWEHCTFTFAIEGVSRSLTHQLVRHRIASYDQQSQRYVNASQFEYVIPPSIKNNKDMCIGFKMTMISLQKVYDIMIQNGIPKEDARFILPNATCSRLICTMNIRSLMHFFALRTCTRSQWEIRELANKMFNLCHEVAPKIFNCRMLCDKLGYCSEGSMSCGKAPTLKEVMEVYNGQNS